ncbi:MAG: hypothetical protein R6V44_16515, partial [Paracoccaceae bacterium]
MLRPFGIRLPGRAGTKRFDEAAHAAVREDDILHASLSTLLGALGAQLAAPDRRIRIRRAGDARSGPPRRAPPPLPRPG